LRKSAEALSTAGGGGTNVLTDAAVDELLGLFTRAETGMAAGSAAALATAVVAATVARAARASGSWEGASGIAAQADTLVARARPLARLDAAAYSAALERLARVAAEEAEAGGRRDHELRRVLEAAADVPLRIADAAADVAVLAAEVAELGDPASRPDMVAGAMLAEASARAAAQLVEVNLAGDRERMLRGRQAGAVARWALERALAAD
jgi:formiminotetrahydrofolate cyclodeaminase